MPRTGFMCEIIVMDWDEALDSIADGFEKRLRAAGVAKVTAGIDKDRNFFSRRKKFDLEWAAKALDFIGITPREFFADALSSEKQGIDLPAGKGRVSEEVRDILAAFEERGSS